MNGIYTYRYITHEQIRNLDEFPPRPSFVDYRDEDEKIFREHYENWSDMYSKWLILKKVSLEDNIQILGRMGIEVNKEIKSELYRRKRERIMADRDPENIRKKAEAAAAQRQEAEELKAAEEERKRIEEEKKAAEDAVRKAEARTAFLESIKAPSEAPEPDWLVEGYIHRHSINWIYGESGSYKSFLALDLAQSVATGTPWAGRNTQQGTVLYWSADDNITMPWRRRAWVQRHGCDGLVIVDDNCDALTSYLECLLDDVGERLLNLDLPPVELLIVDTYSVTASDDSRTEVSKYMAELKRVIAEYGVTVIVLDHANKGGDEYIGSQSKKGDVATMARVVKRKGGKVVLSTSGKGGKMRFGRDVVHTFEMVECEGSLVPVEVDTSTKVDEEIGEARAAVPEKITSAMLLASIMADLGVDMESKEAAAAFYAHPQNQGISSNTQRQRLFQARDRLKKSSK